MLRAAIDPQVGHLAPAQARLGQHAPHGQVQDLLGLLLHQVPDGALAQAASACSETRAIAAMTAPHFDETRT